MPFGLPPEKPTAIIYPDIPDNWRTRIDMQWPVYTFGRFESLERAARSEFAAAGKDVDTFAADVRFDAARAFWALVTATESVRVVEEALALIEAHLRDVKNMREAGLLAPNDVLSVEARRSRQQVQLIEARNMRDVAEADLRRADRRRARRRDHDLTLSLKGRRRALRPTRTCWPTPGRIGPSARRFKPAWTPSAGGATRPRLA